MKVLLARLVALGVLVLTVTTANAQVFQIDYMKAESGDYVQIEQEVWKPIHEERIKAGALLNWTLYSVGYGFDDSYTHVTVNVYPDMAALEASYGDSFPGFVAAAHPDGNWDEISARTEASRHIVKTEIWSGVTYTGDFHAPVSVIAYMKVAQGGWGPYVGMERSIFQPIQEARIADDEMEAWGIYSLWFPGGSDYQYNFAAVNSYQSLTQMSGDSVSMSDRVEAIHPNLSMEQVNHMVNKTRELVRSEVWWTVDHAHGAEAESETGQ